MEEQDEAWRARLEIFKRKITEAEKEISSSKDGYSNLKMYVDLFIKEIHLHTEKMTKEEITQYTDVQLTAMMKLNEHKRMHDTTNISVHAKLPKLELPKFNGDILKWIEFWDRFSSSVDKQNINTVDKLAYLFASLESDAMDAVEGLDITADNYAIAVDILRERFGKPGTVVDAHYEAILNLRKANTATECITTYNQIEKHLRILKSLGEDTNHNNLRKIILNKYPDDLIYELKLRVKIEEKTVDELRRLIEHACTARMSISKSSFISTSTFMNRPDRKGVKRTSTSPQTETVKRRRQSCIFCSGAHYNDECEKVVSIEDRKKKLIGRCFRCFRKDHLSKNCAIQRNCVYCKGKHNRALCVSRGQKISETSHIGNTNKGTSFLQTAVTLIRKDNNLFKCRVLLDTGSQRSYISTEFLKKLKLKVKTNDQLLIYTFGQENPKRIDSPRIEIVLVCENGFEREINVNVVPFITNDIPYINFRECFNINQKLKLADDGSRGSSVDVLIGNDQYFNFIKEERIQLEENFYLINTEFGWVCSGQVPSSQEQVLSFSTYALTYAPENLGFSSPDLPLKENDITQLWELESIGIKDDPKVTNQELALRQFNKTVIYENGRYHVKWPWVQVPPQLPLNYGLAFGRLVSLLRRLDTNTLEAYDQTLKEQEDSGIIEKVEHFTEKSPHQVHYLPHHCVVRRDNTTSKLRIVYDGSSKAKNDLSSLNECMYKGPLLLEDLVGILLRFRQYDIGVIADIEKAFLQLGLQPEDRDVTRFLWLKDIQKGISKDNIQCYRFCRVPFGVVSSPFLLNATIKHHLLSETNVPKKMANNIYVDNLITGARNETKAKQLYTDTYKSFQGISMNLRGWNSNNQEFLREIPTDLKEKEKVTKVLGMLWDTQMDTLAFKSHNDMMDDHFTKRKILQEIASIYDPCGLITPFLLPAKIFLQKLWRLKLPWDTKLPEDLKEEWRKIRKNMKDIYDIKVPRYVGLKQDQTEYELHCFTDASKDAYAAAIYLMSKSDKQKNIQLLMSKTKLTPLKDQENLQIPRLELLGVLIGTRLINYVRENIEVPISNQYLWTDSQVVIKWLNSDKLLPPFIFRRVKEICKSKEMQILYVNTSQNPADIATRADRLSPENIAMWLEGPVFLKSRVDIHTAGIAQNICVSQGPSETEKTKQQETAAGIAQNVCVSQGPSETQKTKQQEAEILESPSENEQNIRQQETEVLEENAAKERTTETQSDINSRIKREQERCYPQEFNGKVTDLSRSLGLFKDEEGILRCRGRVTLANISYDRKYPILLPKDVNVTEEIIMNTHKNNYHVGVGHTLCLLREKYWLPQGRSRVQKILRKCFECKRYGGGPYRLPQMPDLPEERVNYSSPFTFTGLDYLGPLLVTNDKGLTEKRWICLYTCLAVRAVHMEAVADLSAEECVLALRRFIAQKGLPQLFISDNATQFKLTADVMTGSYCIENKVQWKFIPELAPWHGGLYERLVALVKHCIKRTVDTCRLKDNQLHTIIKEIELVLNTRPLTYVGSEPEHILTPIDFLRSKSCLMKHSTEPYLCLSDTFTKSLLIEGWKRGQIILEEFQKMFVNQYLTMLRERKDFKHKQPRILSKKSPEIGDIVQIKGETDNRVLWKIGKIVNLHKGLDNEIRTATVKSGEKEYKRSIGHLYPLEIQETIEEQDHQTQENNEEPTDNLKKVTENRPGRTAAQKARVQISKWTKELVQTIFVRIE